MITMMDRILTKRTSNLYGMYKKAHSENHHFF